VQEKCYELNYRTNSNAGVVSNKSSIRRSRNLHAQEIDPKTPNRSFDQRPKASSSSPSSSIHVLVPLPHPHKSASSLILRHPLRRRPMSPRPLLPAMHHNRRILLRATSLNLLLHIGSVLDILAKVAHVASDFLVGLEREGDDGDEAECKPFPAFHDLFLLG
jgi:hypothetical protein